MSQTRVHVNISSCGTYHTLITSEDQVNELIEAWKTGASDVHSITGATDHRDANTVTHYLKPEDIDSISVQEVKL